jgi:predicted dehydrogenase
LIGSEGLIEIDSQDRGLRYAFTSDGAMTPNPNAFFNQESIFGGESVHGYFVEPIKDFIRNVAFLKQGGTLSDLEGRYPSGLDGLKVTQLAEAVEMSINTGQAVRVDVID